MSFCNIRISGEKADENCFCKTQEALFLQANNVYK